MWGGPKLAVFGVVPNAGLERVKELMVNGGFHRSVQFIWVRFASPITYPFFMFIQKKDRLVEFVQVLTLQDTVATGKRRRRRSPVILLVLTEIKNG